VIESIFAIENSLDFFFFSDDEVLFARYAHFCGQIVFFLALLFPERFLFVGMLARNSDFVLEGREAISIDRAFSLLFASPDVSSSGPSLYFSFVFMKYSDV